MSSSFIDSLYLCLRKNISNKCSQHKRATHRLCFWNDHIFYLYGACQSQKPPVKYYWNETQLKLHIKMTQSDSPLLCMLCPQTAEIKPCGEEFYIGMNRLYRIRTGTFYICFVLVCFVLLNDQEEFRAVTVLGSNTGVLFIILLVLWHT